MASPRRLENHGAAVRVALNSSIRLLTDDGRSEVRVGGSWRVRVDRRVSDLHHEFQNQRGTWPSGHAARGQHAAAAWLDAFNGIWPVEEAAERAPKAQLTT